jgi:hypothetical protein
MSRVYERVERDSQLVRVKSDPGFLDFESCRLAGLVDAQRHRSRVGKLDGLAEKTGGGGLGAVGGGAQAGRMLWFNRNTLSGSYSAFTRASRS